MSKMYCGQHIPYIRIRRRQYEVCRHFVDVLRLTPPWRSRCPIDASANDTNDGVGAKRCGMGDEARRRTSGGRFSPSWRVSLAARARSTCSGVRSGERMEDAVESLRRAVVAEETDETECCLCRQVTEEEGADSCVSSCVG